MKIDLGIIKIDIQLNNTCNQEYEECKRYVEKGWSKPEDIMQIYIDCAINDNYAKNDPGTFIFHNKILIDKQNGRKRFLEEYGLLKEAEIKIKQIKNQKKLNDIIYEER